MPPPTFWTRLSIASKALWALAVGMAAILSAYFGYLALGNERAIETAAPTEDFSSASRATTPSTESSAATRAEISFAKQREDANVSAAPVHSRPPDEESVSNPPSAEKRENGVAPPPRDRLPRLPAIDLIGRICEAKTITVAFQVRPDDNRRYQQLGGAAVLRVGECNEASRSFTIDSNGANYTTPGTVGANSISLSFRYISLQRVIECVVSASGITEFSFSGTISCSGSNDSMDPRPARIDI
jgi:hypothetical protein